MRFLKGRFTLSLLTGVITHPSSAVISGATAALTISLTLPLATTRQPVEVLSHAAELGTQDAVSGQAINLKFINHLPNVGRDVMSMASLNLWRLQ